MLNLVKAQGWWIPAWLAGLLLGCVWIVSNSLERQREAFETDARIVHRLLSQRAVQHDAILSMLVLLQSPGDATHPEQRLPAVYPQILAVKRRDAGQIWDEPHFAAAEAQSRQARRPVLANADFANGNYWLLLAADTSYALKIDMRGLAPWGEWPMQPQTSPVSVALEISGQRFVLQAGRGDGASWRFGFSKHLATGSQPFDVVAAVHVGWAQLPWVWLLAWVVLITGLLAGLRVSWQQHEARRRAEALVRLGKIARLNALGELAAGMAHEVNQPLAAVLANTQAAKRLLADTPPDIATAQSAMADAAQQAQRAAEVVGRLRRSVESPEAVAEVKVVDLQAALSGALYLLAPQLQQCGVVPAVQAAAAVHVQADPVALEQVIHNLLLNAMQALEHVPHGERALILSLNANDGQGVLSVRDSGPGINADVLPRIFEPFFTTREGGLGLGLSLCETLATRMNGSLSAANFAPRGAVFTLHLPLAAET